MIGGTRSAFLRLGSVELQDISEFIRLITFKDKHYEIQLFFEVGILSFGGLTGNQTGWLQRTT
jgi:hypothetical protein